MDARLKWIWLAEACGAGSRLPLGLLHHFGSVDRIYKADRHELAAALHPSQIATLPKLVYKDLSDACEIVKRCDSLGIRILTPLDAAYPKTLYQLRDVPCVLYVLGKLPDFGKNCCCAVVGTRKMSEYGRKMAYDIGRGLGAGGAILISGLALGVDGMAMAGALSAGGVTLGVLGCGLDVVYPPEHQDLMRRVLAEGAVISEYPPGTSPVGSHFPIRNRIISGLSDGVVVVEGDLRSGSLITARHALYQGKDLYAVPGQIGDPGAAGPNFLIKTGARAITSAFDVLKNYEFMYPHSVCLAAAESELNRPASVVGAKDVAVRMNVSASGESKYYGHGNYGGKRTENSAAAPKVLPRIKKEKKITPKTMLARFDEHKEEPRRTMVPANTIDFDMLDENAKTVYAAMRADVPMLADDIRAGSLSTSEILSALTLLELCGAVECTAGSCYTKREEEPSLASVADVD